MHADATLSQADKQILAGSSVFQGLPENEMAHILAAIKIQRYDADRVIISSGDVGDGIYVILEGQVRIFLPLTETDEDKPAKPEMRISLATHEPGACFGEYSLIDQKEVSATVQALSPVRLAHLSTIDFQEIASTRLLAENLIYKNLLRLLVSRCREANMELDGSFLI